MAISETSRRVFQPTFSERLWAIEGVGELIEELIRLSFADPPSQHERSEPAQGWQVLAATLKRETSALCNALEALRLLDEPCPEPQRSCGQPNPKEADLNG
jgi:hypothetical protein